MRILENRSINLKRTVSVQAAITGINKALCQSQSHNHRSHMLRGCDTDVPTTPLTAALTFTPSGGQSAKRPIWVPTATVAH